MTEPDVALTDFALAIECAVIALAVRSGSAPIGPVHRGFAALFLTLAVGSALGGIWHGFLNSYDSTMSLIVWSATLLSLGLTGLVVWFLVSEFRLYRPLRGKIRSLGVVVFAAYGFAVVFVTQAFQLAVLNMLPALVLLLAGYVAEYRRRGEGALLFGVFGILLIFASSLLQQLGLDIHPVYFTHNAIYHVLQGVAFFMLFKSIDGLVEKF